VTELGLALNRSYTGKDGERRDEVVYIDVTVWDRQAETCCQYLKKGRAVHVEGYLKMDSWDDKTTGEKRSKLKVQADRVQFLDRREDAGGPVSTGDDEFSSGGSGAGPRRSSTEYRGGNGSARPASSPTNSAPPRRPAAPPVDSEADSDDIPF
jgi:single-strand DNA-binding protein